METRIVCLAVLHRGPASGYEIKKTLEEGPHLFFQDVSFGSLYPALARLAGDGLVEVARQQQQNKPAKKVYTITEAGRQVLREALCQCPPPDRIRSDFLFLLLHGDLVPAEHLLSALDARIAQFEATIAQMQDCEAKLEEKAPTHRFLVELGLDYYRASVRFLRENRERLRTALSEERARAAE